MRVTIELEPGEVLPGEFTAFLAHSPAAYNRRYKDRPVAAVRFVLRTGEGQQFDWVNGVWVQSVASVS